MPPKAKRKKGKQESKVKKQSSRVSQNVIVNVSKRTSASRQPNNNNAFSKAPIITQSLQAPQLTPAPYVEQYNTILKQMQDERKAILSALPVLASNTAPLTQNIQRNELLNKSRIASPFSPITEAFSKAIKDDVNHETYDDPKTDDLGNNLNNSARLAETIAPRLPIGAFDVDDISEYDNSGNEEQLAVAESVVGVPEARATGRVYSSNAKYAKKQLLYEEYKDLVDSAYKQNPELRDTYKLGTTKHLNTQTKLKNEIEKVKQLMNNK